MHNIYYTLRDYYYWMTICKNITLNFKRARNWRTKETFQLKKHQRRRKRKRRRKNIATYIMLISECGEIDMII